MLQMGNEAWRRKPLASLVSQHLGQSLDAYTDGELTTLLCTWGGSLPLHSLPEPSQVQVEGLLSRSMAPASTPAAGPALPEPLLRVQ